MGASGLAFAPLGAVVAAVQAALGEQNAPTFTGSVATSVTTTNRQNDVALSGSIAQSAILPPRPPRPSPPPDPSTANGRSELYRRYDGTLNQPGTPTEGIRFFAAASIVTQLLGLAENDRLRRAAGITGVLNNAVVWLISLIGGFLYSGLPNEEEGVETRGNEDIYNGLVNGDLVADDGSLISPLTGEPVASAEDWDMHMVWWEQDRVGTILYAVYLDWVSRDLETEYGHVIQAVNSLLRLGKVVNLVEGGETFLYWTDAAVQANTEGPLPGDDFSAINFAYADHRRAMGVALIFQLRYGDTQESYERYMEYMSRAWGMDVPPPINE